MRRKPPVLLWLRNDLRLADQPALSAALLEGGPVVPVFIWAPEEEGRWAPGAASRWWLHQSLGRLDGALRERGSRLVIRRGPTLKTLTELARETESAAVFWTRRYEPAVRKRDRDIQAALQKLGLRAESVNGALLFEPEAIRTADGRPFQVFTAFWRACMKEPAPARPTRAPGEIPGPVRWPKSLPLAKLELEPTIDWAGGMRPSWTPGEAGAGAALREFVRGPLGSYPTGRNIPSESGTSRLSPHLHFGEISPRQVWHAVGSAKSAGSKAIAVYRAELGWREFAHSLLVHFPRTPTEPLQKKFAGFPWTKAPAALRAWRRGATGFPIIDAGMRELWHRGWMHNRVRMVVASFLAKDLLIPWQKGAAWFWDTLVDADLANNTLGWQWTAGCGADAAPYFRIFNPVLQGQRFDPEGAYVRRWAPELAKLPNRWIHRPWEAPPRTLAEAGVELGRTYPAPIVDHAEARARALKAFKTISS